MQQKRRGGEKGIRTGEGLVTVWVLLASVSALFFFSTSLPPSVSLSLSLSHTHAHTHSPGRGPGD